MVKNLDQKSLQEYGCVAFSELQTVCYETANLLNERPIGRHPTSPDDKYLCPNDLLLGRSTSKIPNRRRGSAEYINGPFGILDVDRPTMTC